MARVCIDWFPETNGFYLEDRLKAEIDVLLKNIKNDWDFTILITGNGEVRVGKSMLAMQIGAYWTYQIEKLYGIKNPFNAKDNFVWNGADLITKGNDLGINHKYSCLVFDEAGNDLEGKKTLRKNTQDTLDFYRECGQYNLLNILVIPDFFDLPTGIALTRAIMLLDVNYYVDEEGMFNRGYIKFYSRRTKKKLWIYGRKERNYDAVFNDFGKNQARFYPYWVIDEDEYREKKQDAMKKREATKKNRDRVLFDAILYIMSRKIRENGQPLMRAPQLSQEISEFCGEPLAERTIQDRTKIIEDEILLAQSPHPVGRGQTSI